MVQASKKSIFVVFVLLAPVPGLKKRVYVNPREIVARVLLVFLMILIRFIAIRVIYGRNP